MTSFDLHHLVIREWWVLLYSIAICLKKSSDFSYEYKKLTGGNLSYLKWKFQRNLKLFPFIYDGHQ